MRFITLAGHSALGCLSPAQFEDHNARRRSKPPRNPGGFWRALQMHLLLFDAMTEQQRLRLQGYGRVMFRCSFSLAWTASQLSADNQAFHCEETRDRVRAHQALTAP